MYKILWDYYLGLLEPRTFENAKEVPEPYNFVSFSRFMRLDLVSRLKFTRITSTPSKNQKFFYTESPTNPLHSTRNRMRFFSYFFISNLE